MISKRRQRELERQSEKTLREIVRGLYSFRRNLQMTRVEFRGRLLESFKALGAEALKDPVLALADAVNRALTLVALADAIRRQKFTPHTKPLKLQVPPTIRRAFVENQRRTEKTLADLLRPEAFEEEGDEEGAEVPGMALQGAILESAFLRIFTGVETYLQDTLGYALNDPARREAFLKALEDDDMPTRWADGTRIRRSEYALRMGEVMGLMLKFPYHDFAGRVGKFYRYCFGFDLTDFVGLARLIQHREVRHALVHRGAVRMGLPLVDITKGDVIELGNLAYRLVDYVERRKPRAASGAPP